MQELGNQLRTFYTQEKEKYECLIPSLELPKEEEKTNEPEQCKWRRGVQS